MVVPRLLREGEERAWYKRLAYAQTLWLLTTDACDTMTTAILYRIIVDLVKLAVSMAVSNNVQYIWLHILVLLSLMLSCILCPSFWIPYNLQYYTLTNKSVFELTSQPGLDAEQVHSQLRPRFYYQYKIDELSNTVPFSR